MRKSLSLLSLFSAAAFRGFGGVPLASLTPIARANHKKNWTDTPRHQSIHQKHGDRERTRRLAFKARHGHFA